MASGLGRVRMILHSSQNVHNLFIDKTRGIWYNK